MPNIKTKNTNYSTIVVDGEAVSASNPLPVQGGGGGGGTAGTEYTEDAPAVSNPVGPMSMAVRRDTLSASEVSADGDVIALKATSKGQLHVFAEITGGVGGGGGDATAANQTTLIGHVDGIETLITASNTKLDALESGKATAALQTSANTKLDTLATKLDTLEAGKATAANQATGNSSLSSIDTKLTNNATSTLQTAGNASLTSIDSKFSTNNTSLSSIDGKLTGIATAANQTSTNTKLDTLNTTMGNFVTDYLSNTNPATVAQDTSILRVGPTNVTPKFAVITASAAGETAVVAAVTGKKIRVLNYVLTRSGAVNVKFQSGTSDITGLLYEGAAAAYSPLGQFETAAGAALNINLSGAVAVGGHITYIEV